MSPSNKVVSAASVLLVTSIFACSNPDPMTVTVDFRRSGQGWVGDFADDPVGEDAFYELATGYGSLPAPLSGSGLFISGNNHSDDLWMYYKGQIAGLSTCSVLKGRRRE